MRVGIAGFGFMGRMHYGNWMKMPEVEVTGICDSNPDIAKSFGQTIGNIPGLPDHIDLSKLNFYADFDEMLKAEQLDAISITLPTYLHADLSCKALQAGIHVLCEKPMALNIQQCRQMHDAAEQTGKHLMVAHCIRFWPEYVDARQRIHSGQYGNVFAANFRRFSARPSWSRDNWLLDTQRSGGMVLDFHIHDTDYIQNLFGMPTSVRSRTFAPSGTIGYIKTDYFYDTDMLITAEGSILAADSFDFRMSFEIFLEKATILYDCTREPAYRICPCDSEPFSPSVPEKDGYYAEIEYFLSLIQGKVSGDIITLQQSLDSVRIIEAEKASSDSGETVKLNR